MGSETLLILVVDDHDETRRVLSLLLSDEGYATIAAASVTEALELLETAAPALVITDLEMPGLNGLTLLRKIRSEPRYRHIPVIVFTGHAGVLRDVALSAGADAYVLKDSMDWATLQRHILHLAGPGTLDPQLPAVPALRLKDAG